MGQCPIMGHMLCPILRITTLRHWTPADRIIAQLYFNQTWRWEA